MTRERPLRILLLALLSGAVAVFGLFVGTGMLGRQLLFLSVTAAPATAVTWPQQVVSEQPIDRASFVDRQLPEKFAVETAANVALWFGGLVLLAVAYGLLHMRRWAVWLGLLYAAGMLLCQTAYFLYQVSCVLPATQEYYASQTWRMYYGYGSATGMNQAMGFVFFLLLQVGVFVGHALLLAAVLASLAFRRAEEPEIRENPAETPAGAALSSV